MRGEHSPGFLRIEFADLDTGAMQVTFSTSYKGDRIGSAESASYSRVGSPSTATTIYIRLPILDLDATDTNHIKIGTITLNLNADDFSYKRLYGTITDSRNSEAKQVELEKQ
ncbi:hypothetical protein ASE80_00195 [Pseudomonas sp. Leaf15]|nr:hypothetical protein ASE80_00195 [Pseudomonas sp. Leaf15]RAH04109.1 hypothetical protein DJ480_06660 [Pseudomonas sp. Leaf98]